MPRSGLESLCKERSETNFRQKAPDPPFWEKSIPHQNLTPSWILLSKNRGVILEKGLKSVQDKLLDLLGPILHVLMLADEALSSNTHLDPR